MTVRTIDEIFRDFVTDGVPASGPFNPHKPDIRDTLKALTEGSENFPDNRVIRLNNANEGTANNIVVTASVAIPAAAYQVLYILNVTQENTGPVKVSGAINRDLVTNTSQPIETGYLQPGMALLCIDTGTELRLLSYGADEAILAAAEAAADRAEDAAAAAEAAVGGQLSNFDSRASVATATILPLVSYVRTAGYYAAGDGGAALYKRASSEPAHAGKVQSADGAWWELVEPVVTPFMFGAKGDLVNDDADAINNCFAFFKIKNCGCFIPSPSKGYAISKPLQVYLTADWDSTWQGYRGKQLIIDKAANFKATATMTQMLLIGQDIVVGSEYEGIVRDGLLQGGRFDCNNLADYGVRVPFFELIRINDVTVWNAKKDYFSMGDASTPANSYEGMFSNCYTDMDRTRAAPSGSLGIRYTNASDHHVTDCVFKGVKRAGIGGDGTWHMKITNVHVWNNDSMGALEYGFELAGDNQLIGCQVDEQWQYSAYRFLNKNNFLIGCNITKEKAGIGGHFCDLDTNGAVTAIGCKIVAQPGHELAGEVTGGGYRNYSSIGCVVSGNNNPSNNGRIRSGSAIRTGVFTVSTLPSSPLQGDRAFVTDASSTTFGADLVGGGPNWVPVYYNGGGWKIG